jgi:hypothetical protein
MHSPLNPNPLGPEDYGTNLWLEITNIIAGEVYIWAHNAERSAYLELLSSTNLVDWTLEQETALDSGSPPNVLFTVPENGRPTLFFRAAQAPTRVGIDTSGDQNAIRPGPCYPTGQPGVFTLHREGYSGSYGALTVCYRVTGTASNGVDYALLDGSVTIPSDEYQWPIEVDALSSFVFTNRTLTISLAITNGYVLDPNYASSATILIEPNFFGLVATNLVDPVGLDYHPLTESLLLSINPGKNAGTNFVRIDSGGGVSDWTNISDITRSVTIATVKTNAHNFHEGEMYFDSVSYNSLGWLSSDASAYKLDWAVFTAPASPIGGLYVDLTGVWGGDLIATVGGDHSEVNDVGSLWRINSSGQSTHLLDFPQPLGGVITLPNDPAQWGPWAGKIITGEAPEPFPYLDDPKVYAVDTNLQAVATALGFQAEHINLIPTNQAFYCSDSLMNTVWKVPADVFTNHVGHLLFTAVGEVATTVPPALYIVHWDSNPAVTNFVVEKIDTPEFVGCLEDGTFAPIEILCMPH